MVKGFLKRTGTDGIKNYYICDLTFSGIIHTDITKMIGPTNAHISPLVVDNQQLIG